MSHLASLTSFKEIRPLSFRLTSNWGETTQSEKEACIEKASETCQVICEVISPNASEELFQAMNSSSDICLTRTCSSYDCIQERYYTKP